MNKQVKPLLYFLITMILYYFLVLPFESGLGVVVYYLIQMLMFYDLLRDKRVFLIFGAIFLLSLNYYFSYFVVFHILNRLAIFALYCFAGVLLSNQLNLSKEFSFIFKSIINGIANFFHIDLLIGSLFKKENKNQKIFKSMLIGLIFSIPVVIFVLLLLTEADSVFSLFVDQFLNYFYFDLKLYDWLFSLGAGLFFFGTYISIVDPHENKIDFKMISFQIEPVIINVVLSITLIVYSLFVFIQFKYLFAQAGLPAGITYSEYAVRGFMELVVLTVFNVVLIILSRRFTKNQMSKSVRFNKLLLHSLCTITLILLASSLVRMNMYTQNYGLTRLRLIVYIFLIFEAIGLLITYYFIERDRLNLTIVYFSLAVVYYVVLNVMPIDRIVARNLVDRYLNHKQNDIEYVLQLSLDVAPEIESLFNDPKMGNRAKYFLVNKLHYVEENRNEGWIYNNYSVDQARKIAIKHQLLKYPTIRVVDNEELGCIELIYNDVVYRPFGVLSNDKLKGTQIGIREDSLDSKIYEVKGYEITEWIVDYLEVFMGGNMLFKAVGVNEIPKELEQYKQYDY